MKLAEVIPSEDRWCQDWLGLTAQGGICIPGKDEHPDKVCIYGGLMVIHGYDTTELRSAFDRLNRLSVSMFDEHAVDYNNSHTYKEVRVLIDAFDAKEAELVRS